jgi:hypothetical protein
MEAAAWAVAEAAEARLGDRRLNRTWARILTALLPSAGRSFSAAVGDGLRQGASGLFHRPGLTVDDLLAGHYSATAQRCSEEELVLVPQDSMVANYTRHRATAGLGRLADKDNARGLWAHSAQAMTTTGRPLGLLSLRLWARGPARTKAQRHARPYAEKESYKWEAGLRDVEAALPLDCQAVVISDRESDVFEYLRARVRPGLFKLVRASWPRRCAGAEGAAQGQVLAAVRDEPVAAQVRFAVPRGPGHPSRLATLAVRFTHVAVQSPKSWPAAARASAALAVIAIDEVGAPAGVKPLSWTLLTDWPVADEDEALRVVDWYRRRWRVEEAHRALKLDGYRVERLQFDTAEALQLALATYWVVAWRAMNLALEAREHPELPAQARFEPDELEVLSLLRGATVATLAQAVHEVAKLGGWAGYRSSPPPGIKVVQQGLLLLESMVRYHRALREAGRGGEM